MTLNFTYEHIHIIYNIPCGIYGILYTYFDAVVVSATAISNCYTIRRISEKSGKSVEHFDHANSYNKVSNMISA